MKKETKKRYMFIGQNAGNPITLSFNRYKTLTLKFGNVVWLDDVEYNAYSTLFEPLPEVKTEPEVKIEQKIKTDINPLDTLTKDESEDNEVVTLNFEPETVESDVFTTPTEEELLKKTNKELKGICEKLGLDGKGNKKNLIEIILEKN